MARSDWDWQPKSRRPQDIANVHACLALLRIYRGVQLPLGDMDMGAAARPFWPVFRLHPDLFRQAVADFRPSGRGRRRRPGPFEDDLKSWADTLSALKTLPAAPVDGLDPIGEGMLTDASSFRPLLDAMETTLAGLAARHALPEEPKLQLLAGLLKLDGPEQAFLRLCVAVQSGTVSTSAFACARAPTRLVQAVRLAIGARDDHAVRTMLRRTAPLVRSGLLDSESIGSCHDMEDLLRLSRQATLLFGSPAASLAEMAQLVLRSLPAPVDDSLQWPHLADRTALLQRLLSQALQQRAPGINLLLYGAPGTGKTQYAQQLVQAIGAVGFSVADRDADGDAASRHERLASLMLTQVFAPDGRSVVVLDEAEDIFTSEYNNPFARALGRREDSKSWMNSLLEGNRHPVVWISNRIDNLDPAYLRRFSYCLEFPQTPRRVRAEIARRHLEPVGISEPVIQAVAAAPAVSPALVASASRFVTLAALKGPEADAGVKTMLGDMVTALGDEFAARLPERATRYDTRYLNVKGLVTPDHVLAALERTRRGRAILAGPPGTGKTQLAAEVSLRLGRELVYRTASDINSMWFGQSERNVAKMFKECDTGSEVLFLDEADTLLGSRDAAQNRPEHAVTAEFLRQVEQFQGVFLCATNYGGRLDAALLRRFEFKLEFQPLAVMQRLALFCETALGWSGEGDLPEVPRELQARLERMDQLTPGDYANVVRRLQALGLSPGPAEWLGELEAEHAAKPGGVKSAIGFL